MKPDDPNIKWIEEPRLGLAGKMYLPLVNQQTPSSANFLTYVKVA